MRRGVSLTMQSALVALGTWLVGWWAIPVVIAGWQFVRRDEAAWPAGAAGVVGWGALLLLSPIAPLGRLTVRLAGLFHLPPWGIVAVTLGYPFLLGWSAARVTAALLRRQGTRIAKVTTAPPGSRTDSSSIP
jgi:hypothetical protein